MSLCRRFLIVTIGFGEIVRIALRNDVHSLVFLSKIPGLQFLKEKLTGLVITGGPNGIFGINRPAILGFTFRQQWHYYYLFLAFVVLTIFAMRRLENSRLGRAWTCVREDELAAEAMGIDTVRVKLLAFAIGAAWAGVAGNLYASWVTVIAPESFSFWESVIMFCSGAGRHGLHPQRAGRHGGHGRLARDPARGSVEHPAMANAHFRGGDDHYDGLPP